MHDVGCGGWIICSNLDMTLCKSCSNLLKTRGIKWPVFFSNINWNFPNLGFEVPKWVFWFFSPKIKSIIFEISLKKINRKLAKNKISWKLQNCRENIILLWRAQRARKNHKRMTRSVRNPSHRTRFWGSTANKNDRIVEGKYVQETRFCKNFACGARYFNVCVWFIQCVHWNGSMTL